MIDRIDTHPTPRDPIYIDQRSGKDRRKIHTMLDPTIYRRKGDRRKKNLEERPQEKPWKNPRKNPRKTLGKTHQKPKKTLLLKTLTKKTHPLNPKEKQLKTWKTILGKQLSKP